MEIGIGLLAVLGQRSVKKRRKKKGKRKTSESRKKKLQFGGSFVQEGGAFKDPLENTGELFVLLYIPSLCGNEPEPEEKWGIRISAGKSFSQ